MRLTFNKDVVMKKYKDKAINWMEEATYILKKWIDDYTPEDTLALIQHNKKLVDIQQNKIFWVVYNDLWDYAWDVEYWMGQVMKYHKYNWAIKREDRDIILVGNWAHMFAIWYEENRDILLKTLKEWLLT